MESFAKWYWIRRQYSSALKNIIFLFLFLSCSYNVRCIHGCREWTWSNTIERYMRVNPKAQESARKNLLTFTSNHRQWPKTELSKYCIVTKMLQFSRRMLNLIAIIYLRFISYPFIVHILYIRTTKIVYFSAVKGKYYWN